MSFGCLNGLAVWVSSLFHLLLVFLHFVSWRGFAGVCCHFDWHKLWPGRVCDSLALEWHRHTAHMVVILTLNSWGFFKCKVGDQFLTALAPGQRQYNAWFQHKARECKVEAEGYSDIASEDAMIAIKILMKCIQLLRQKTKTFPVFFYIYL